MIPKVGEVLATFQNSILKHSFHLNSIFPSSFSVLGLSKGLIDRGGKPLVGVKPGKDRDKFRGEVMDCRIIYEKEMSHRDFGGLK